MSKKTNTLLFILGGTIFNVLITVFCFILLLVLFIRFLQPVVPESAFTWIMPVIFIAAIAVSFVVYRLAIKQVTKRVDMEKYFDPIFTRRRPPQRKD